MTRGYTMKGQGATAWHNSSAYAQWINRRNFSHGAQRNNHGVIDCDWLFAYFFAKKKVG